MTRHPSRDTDSQLEEFAIPEQRKWIRAAPVACYASAMSVRTRLAARAAR
jgi:hypothetical protein